MRYGIRSWGGSSGLSVSFIQPLQRAWERARRMLFTRFDIEKWLVLGFAAFLAGLADIGFASGVESRWSFPFRARSWDDWSLFGFSRWDLQSGWIFFLAPLIIFAVALALVLLWVGSRGKFIFLDGVVRDRAAIVEPWRQYKRVGDSLFLWRIGLWLVCLLSWGVFVAPLLFTLRWGGGGDVGPWLVLPLVGVMLLALLLGIVLAFVLLYLESFVVPIMYARDLSSTAAWGHFLPLLKRNVADFVLYGIFVLLLCIAVALSLAALTLATCCVILPLLALPYINRVVLLPLSVTYRLYSLEFLAQFGPDYFSLPQLQVQPPPRTSL